MERVEQGVLFRAQTGDLDAFTAIVQAYEDQLYTLAFRFLSNSAEAQDAVQETFLRVYTQLRRYDERFKFTTWLYRIATNVCIDRLRKRKAVSSLDAEVTDGVESLQDWHERLASPDPSPEDLLMQSETCNEVQRALGDLPPLYQTVIILRYIQELSLQEISDVLHVPITTVKTRIHRGREALKELLARAPVS
ncbi:MAG: RNA polymerase sigma factor SigW [Firmicutes bacterium]|nr:RNA polymerase sigma factor SigW [Bacillota bacterium]